MLRHDDVAEQREIVAVANFAEDIQEDIATPLGSEEWQSAITAAGDEVQVSEAIAALQFVPARRRKHAPLYPQRCGTHNFYSLALCDVLCGGRGVAFIQ